VFDRAAEGYFNLTISGRLKGRPAGDDVDMIRARRTVFDAGHYRPIHDAVAAMVGTRRPDVVLDAGCGEGAYLATIDAPVRLGTDVSKPAVRLAAKRHRDLRFAVASSFDLPLDDGAVDVVVSVFAPRAFAEFHRVLRVGGAIVIASPGPDHLAGLTELVYGQVKPHEQRPHASDDEGHAEAPTARERVRFRLHLTEPRDIEALLHMTPYWWRATDERRAEIAASTELVTTVDVVITLHERPADMTPDSP
jgi:23S rRNA (guanine745-N1)-methyltransferase